MSTWSDPPGGPGLPARPVRFGFRSTAAVFLAGWAALVSCDRSAVPRAASQSRQASPAERKVRVVRPRGVPRVPFHLDLQAEMLDPVRCELRVSLRSAEGGPACLEFSLPPGVAAEGELYRECWLEGQAGREERLVVRVPPEGHRLLGVLATVEGRRAEAYVEFGEPPRAEERGLRTRQSAEGDQVLRIGPEEL